MKVFGTSFVCNAHETETRVVAWSSTPRQLPPERASQHVWAEFEPDPATDRLEFSCGCSITGPSAREWIERRIAEESPAKGEIAGFIYRDPRSGAEVHLHPADVAVVRRGDLTA